MCLWQCDNKPEFVGRCVYVVVYEGVGLGSCVEVGVSDTGMECKFDTVQGHRLYKSYISPQSPGVNLKRPILMGGRANAGKWEPTRCSLVLHEMEVTLRTMQMLLTAHQSHRLLRVFSVSEF